MRAIILLMILACTASLGRADAVSDAAKDHFEHGQTLFNGGHYLEARVEFMAGFDLSHRALFLFNAAECSRLVGERDAAREGYTRYLQLEPSGNFAALAHQRLTDLGPAAPPSASPAMSPAVPPPAVAATRAAAAPQSTPTTTGTVAVERAEPEPSVWHRKGVWIGVGIGVAVIAGSVAVYAATRHQDTCMPPGCVVVP